MSATDDYAAFQARREQERQQVKLLNIRSRWTKIIGAPADSPMGELVWRGNVRAYCRQLPGGAWEVGRWVKRELHPEFIATSKHEAFGMAVELVLNA